MIHQTIRIRRSPETPLRRRIRGDSFPFVVSPQDARIRNRFAIPIAAARFPLPSRDKTPNNDGFGLFEKESGEFVEKVAKVNRDGQHA